MAVDPMVGSEVVSPVACNRARVPAGSQPVNVRLTDQEMHDVAAAAGRAGRRSAGRADPCEQALVRDVDAGIS